MSNEAKAALFYGVNLCDEENEEIPPRPQGIDYDAWHSDWTDALGEVLKKKYPRVSVGIHGSPHLPWVYLYTVEHSAMDDQATSILHLATVGGDDKALIEVLEYLRRDTQKEKSIGWYLAAYRS